MPHKVLLGQRENETTRHILLKFLAYILFFRERIQIEGNLHNDNIPFEPDIVQLDYELRPKLWVECGECSVNKLNKLAVKVPEAEIWVVKRSLSDAQHLFAAMAKEELRRDRYSLIGLEGLGGYRLKLDKGISLDLEAGLTTFLASVLGYSGNSNLLLTVGAGLSFTL